MILISKGKSLHKAKDVFSAAQILKKADGIKTYVWQVSDALKHHDSFRGWRLQGFPDWAFNRAKEAGLSDSQLYKQAGNSVTVPVIIAEYDAKNGIFEEY